jgi:membrane-associated phospholipid phosphatase
VVRRPPPREEGGAAGERARLVVFLNALDLALYRRIRSLARTPGRVDLACRFSALGEHAAIWLATGLLGAVVNRRCRRRWLRATACVAASHATSTTIKVVVARRRPAVEDLPHLMATPTGLSFPSSAATAMAATRVYLGVHYPSDVAAGAALGIVLGTLGR